MGTDDDALDSAPAPLDPALFAAIAAAYTSRFPCRLGVIDIDGRLRLRQEGFPDLDATPAGRDRGRLLVREALRWGETYLTDFPPDLLVWASPLMHNQEGRGAVLATLPEAVLFPTDTAGACFDFQEAATVLREALEESNCTNAAYLASRREAHDREQDRAYALHEAKRSYPVDLGATYLQAEPHLLSALARGDRQEAMEIVNRLLVLVYHSGGEDLERVKSQALELVVAMVGTAVATGGAPRDLLGVHYRSLQELGAIDDEKGLAEWLASMLDRIMDTMLTQRPDDDTARLKAALAFLRRHFAKPVRRRDAAAVACCSPSHFSRLLREKIGRSFTDLLNQIRVDHAAALLRRSEREIAAIALDTGFTDQSYFTKVFSRYTGMTPKEFRTRLKG